MATCLLCKPTTTCFSHQTLTPAPSTPLTSSAMDRDGNNSETDVSISSSLTGLLNVSGATFTSSQSNRLSTRRSALQNKSVVNVASFSCSIQPSCVQRCMTATRSVTQYKITAKMQQDQTVCNAKWDKVFLGLNSL